MKSEPYFEMPTTFLRGIGISVRLLGRDRLLFFACAQNGGCYRGPEQTQSK